MASGQMHGIARYALELARRLPALEYGRKQAAYYKIVVRPRALFAKALITVSEFSRDELARHLGISPYRFQVIPQGVSMSPPSPADVADFARRRGLPARWFAAVGNAKPFKNLELIAKLAPSLPAPVAVLGGAHLPRTENLIALPALEENEL